MQSLRSIPAGRNSPTAICAIVMLHTVFDRQHARHNRSILLVRLNLKGRSDRIGAIIHRAQSHARFRIRRRRERNSVIPESS